MKKKILHSPSNIAGIGGHLASYQRKKGHDARFFVSQPNQFFDNHDGLIVPADAAGWLSKRLSHLFWALHAMWQYDIYVFYFGRTLLPLNIDLPLLRILGKKTVMVYCGSDARLIGVERVRNPYWALIEGDLKTTLNDIKYDARKKRMLKFQGLFLDKVVAPRNLYKPVSLYIDNEKIVKDLWIHNLSVLAIDARQEFKKDSIHHHAERSIKPLRLLHMPSNPAIKGTKYIRKAIDILRKSGYDFDYAEITGVSQPEALSEIRDADLVIDQILLGGFGSLSVEAMSMGKPVVCYLLEAMKNEHYPDCPIVNANLDNLADILESLLLDSDRRKMLGESGVAYHRAYFDYEEVNNKFLDMLLNL